MLYSALLNSTPLHLHLRLKLCSTRGLGHRDGGHPLDNNKTPTPRLLAPLQHPLSLVILSPFFSSFLAAAADSVGLFGLGLKTLHRCCFQRPRVPTYRHPRYRARRRPFAPRPATVCATPRKRPHLRGSCFFLIAHCRAYICKSSAPP